MGEPSTFFAPAERAPPSSIERSRKRLAGGCPELRVVDSLPLMTLAVNAERQAIFASREFLRFLGDPPVESVMGRRPGEILGCVNADKGPGGCGTSRFCVHCGAVRALLRGLEGVPAEEECRLLRTKEGEREALDLRVWATPLTLDQDRITLFTVLDVSDQKRRALLERIFFHDVLNTAGAVHSLAGFLCEEALSPAEEKQIKTALRESTDRLVAEIRSQRVLALAEAGSLEVQPATLDVAVLVSQVVREYEKHADGKGVTLRADLDSEVRPIRTDPPLAGRVLGNLVKNAVEASGPGDEVHVATSSTEDGVEVSVRNPAFMSDEVQSQVFHRSFSTKGRDRGLGTWSVKLLTERYLGGRVTFTSTADEGTIFRVQLPHAI